MEQKFKSSITLNLIKLIIWICVSCILWVIIFSIVGPEESETIVEPFPHAVFICGVATALLVMFIMNYNSANKERQNIKAEFSNIKVLNKRSTVLLEKANKVADKYMTHERTTQVGVAKERKSPKVPFTKKIRSASQFETAMENYPDLKANESIMELLKQIRESENAISNAKVAYNDFVARYNTMIHNFPFSLVRKLLKFEDEEFYQEEETIISDEELGI